MELQILQAKLMLHSMNEDSGAFSLARKNLARCRLFLLSTDTPFTCFPSTHCFWVFSTHFINNSQLKAPFEDTRVQSTEGSTALPAV